MRYSEENLIEGCVEKLKNIGFVKVSKETIFKDEVYKYHLKIFINSLKGQTDNLDKAIKEIVLKMENSK